MADRTSSPLPTSQQIPDTEVRVKEEGSTSPTATEPIPTVPLSPTRSPRKTEGQRRAFLWNDPQSGDVEPQRVLCRVCEKWIRLSPISNYSAANWLAHKGRCSPATPVLRRPRRAPSKPTFSPSSRVATAERKIVLLNDPQVKVCSPKRVQCGNCMSVVVLEGMVDYELTKWIEHKGTCIPMIPAPITPRGPASHIRSHNPPSSQASAEESQRSPSPVGGGEDNRSTEQSVVTEGSPVAVNAGSKRGRDEEEAEAVEDARPTNRARTDPSKPAETSLYGLFVRPLKEFARGFREGLGST